MHKQIIKYVVNEPETITPPKLLYEFTYPELLEAQKPVVDEKGQLWAGKDRRNTLQDESGKIALWKAWQQSFKTRNVVPQHAMDYFQNTKHLSRPPKEGDVGLVDKNKLVAVSEAPRFTWSPSKLSDFETCPYQFAAKHYYKTIPYQETEATIWGTRVHKQAELAMKEEPITDEEAYAVVKPFVELLRKVPGKRFMEQQMALDENFKPMADWYNGTARMIVDLAIEDGDTVKLFDYKTGKMKDDQTQMKIYALVWALHNPAIKKISCKYIWVKHKKTTGFEMTRDELLPVFKEIKAKVDAVKVAWDNENFPSRKNGLCRSWCGATDCPHCGR